MEGISSLAIVLIIIATAVWTTEKLNRLIGFFRMKDIAYKHKKYDITKE